MHIVSLFQLNISLNVDFVAGMAGGPGKCTDRPYLSLRLFPNCSHQGGFAPFVFRYFRLKFWLDLVVNYLFRFLNFDFGEILAKFS